MNRRRIVFLTRNYKTTLSGGAKARIDVEDILESEGAVNLGLSRTFRRDKAYDYLRNLAGLVCCTRRLRRGDVLVVQYPLKKYYSILCRMAKRRGASVVTLVHDLGSFRRHRLTPEEEIARLSLTDVAVVANTNTKTWLEEHGYRKPTVIQQAWDYLSDAEASGKEQPPMSCVFVGNCNPSRNGYLYKISPEIELHLYGGGIPDDVAPNIHPHGLTEPDRIISTCEGRFSLIWYDSELKHSREGYIGDYIIYANSHKLALYILAGKPVIVWSGSGMAQFVKQEGIGLCLDSLENLPATLAAVSDSEYEEMRGNVRRLAGSMRKGQFARRWLREAMEKLSASAADNSRQQSSSV